MDKKDKKEFKNAKRRIKRRMAAGSFALIVDPRVWSNAIMANHDIKPDIKFYD